ncbi:MAG: hypothetical protein Q8N01_07420 [Sulfuricurvum sp.]|nr:hypothetical protein [Sulfuricurvum sp.]MDP3021849.1 hypothetical protein [Sulfuricurvum sp.]MDP3120227.1 hypothetical protein [Sulfuricurvum sp.]
MADDNKKLYLELQMDELKAALGIEVDHSVPESNKKEKIAKLKDAAEKSNRAKNADVAKLYENAAEYEKELECFEKELEIVNTNKFKDIAAALTQNFPDEDRNYAQELKTVVVAGWIQLVEVERTHSVGQLDLIKETEFSDIVEKLSAAYPDYNGDFEKTVRGILVQRLENLISIKKEHIEEEIEEIYIAGLKPSFVKRIYKEYHGIS